jgi:putative transposase
VPIAMHHAGDMVGKEGGKGVGADALKKTAVALELARTGRFQVKPLAEALGIGRSNLIEQRQPATGRRSGFGPRPDDEWLLPLIRAIVAERASYGYRWVTALLNRQFEAQGRARVNHKRIYRIMRLGHLLPRYSGRRERTHDGVVVTLKSNLRWCSDVFTIRCWNGEAVQVLFSLDCCDLEAMGWLATNGGGVSGELVRDLMSETVEYRFGPAALGAPHPVEWLSDNGPCYTARKTCEFAHSLGLLVCTTPTYSPQSNGVAEAFVKTFKRDYYVNQLPSAPEVIAQLPGWFTDYNEVHPHKGLGMRSPREYLRAVS